MNNDIFKGIGIPITLPEPMSSSFLKIRETLQRVGMASNHNQTLFQTCHILHKRGMYRLVHFKELFKLDNKPATLTEEDYARRNTICDLLEEWKLLTISNPTEFDELPQVDMSTIKVIPFKEKQNWKLVSKYNIGKKH